MRALSLERFEQMKDVFDQAVMETPHIDQFCSSTPWILPADAALMGPGEPWLRQGPEGWVALRRSVHPELGRFLQPLEGSWSFASGLIGKDPLRLAIAFHRDLLAHSEQWDALLLTGLAEGSPIWHSLLLLFSRSHNLFRCLPTSRYLVQLEGGVEGFLGRRSANFRRTMRRCQRRVSEEGLSYETLTAANAGDPGALFERILEVEFRSWKGRDGVGIAEGGMRAFYQMMLPRLVEKGWLHLTFARQAGRDVGYILGATVEDQYRGLQFSYDDDLRSLGLGNAMQLREMEVLGRAGYLVYDLGSDAPYKTRWADSTFETVGLLVRPKDQPLP